MVPLERINDLLDFMFSFLIKALCEQKKTTVMAFRAAKVTAPDSIDFS